MTYIPFENKVSLINKYVQINILQNKGKKEHVDIPENEIFTAIIDDMRAHNEAITQPPRDSLQPVIDALREYQSKQSDMRFQLNALMHTLETVRDEDSAQVSMDDIIANLKMLDQK
ncbi:MAG: hypothetical protein DRI71_11770 [Bacteroidetes bacterium]|nr:MAG: hypothetical protein DRI71_11770 [Bacteroidota bacterium]